MAVKVVFIHGWGANPQVFDALAKKLKCDYSCVSLDDMPMGANLEAEQQIALAVEYIADSLQQPVVLVGWSLGGMLAVRVAAEHPQKVLALVTLAALPTFVARPSLPSAMSEADFEKFRMGFSTQPIQTWQRFGKLQLMGDASKHAVQQWLKQTPPPEEEDQQKRLAQQLDWLACLDNFSCMLAVSCPVLHLYGGADRVVPQQAGLEFESWLQQQGLHNQAVHLYPQHAHVLPVAAATEAGAEVLVAINRLLDQLTPIDRCKNLIDKEKIAASFGRAAATYNDAACVQKRCAAHLASTFTPKMRPGDVLADLGAGTGYLSDCLKGQSECSLLAIDIALGMLKLNNSRFATVADVERLPLKTHSVDGLVSSFALQWVADLSQVFSEAHRVLAHGGQFAFNILFDGTLHQLREAWSQINDYVHVNAFVSEQLVEQALASAGFNILKQARITEQQTFDELFELLKSLKKVGAHNMNAGQNPGLTHPSALKRLKSLYEQYRNDEGKLPLDYDVGYYLVEKS